MFSYEAQALQDAISELQRSSQDFIRAITERNSKEQGRQSATGLNALRSTINILLSFRDNSGSYDMFDNASGIGKLYTKNINDNMVNDVLKKGSVVLMNVDFQIPSISILLNKIKHAKGNQSTFEVINGEHVLILSGDKYQNQPRYILIFKICDLCDLSERFVKDVDQFYSK